MNSSLTPRARRLKAMANAYATAKAVACNPDMGAQVFDAALNKAGFKVVPIRNRVSELGSGGREVVRGVEGPDAGSAGVDLR